MELEQILTKAKDKKKIVYYAKISKMGEKKMDLNLIPTSNDFFLDQRGILPIAYNLL